jgi:hypothetical protein
MDGSDSDSDSDSSSSSNSDGSCRSHFSPEHGFGGVSRRLRSVLFHPLGLALAGCFICDDDDDDVANFALRKHRVTAGLASARRRAFVTQDQQKQVPTGWTRWTRFFAKAVGSFDASRERAKVGIRSSPPCRRQKFSQRSSIDGSRTA